MTMIKLLKTVLSSTYYQKHVSCQTNEQKLRIEIIIAGFSSACINYEVKSL